MVVRSPFFGVVGMMTKSFGSAFARSAFAVVQPAPSGVLDADALAAAKAQGQSLAFDPMLMGWIAVSDLPQTADLTLRPWRRADAGRYGAMLSDEAVWAYLPERFGGALSAADAEQMIEATHARATHFVRAILLGGAPVGQVRVDFGHGAPRAIGEISYWLGRDHWGKGIATRAIGQMVQAAFELYPELRQIEARVHPDNIASARALQKSGFAFQAKREDANGWRYYAKRR